MGVEKLLEGDSYNASVFAVTANISCVRPTYYSECFPSNSKASCSWSQSFEPIQNASSDIFPKYMLSILCAKVAVSMMMERAGISTGSVTLLNAKLTFMC